MLNYNQKLTIIFKDADILTARNYNAFAGLGAMQYAKNKDEQKQIDRLKLLKTYNEVRQTNKRTPYKEYMNQF